MRPVPRPLQPEKARDIRNCNNSPVAQRRLIRYKEFAVLWTNRRKRPQPMIVPKNRMNTPQQSTSVKAAREEATVLAAQLKQARKRQAAAKIRYRLSKAAAKRAKKAAKRDRKSFKAAKKEVAALQEALRLAVRNTSTGPTKSARKRRKQTPSSSRPVKRSSRAKKSGRPVRLKAVLPGRKQPKIKTVPYRAPAAAAIDLSANRQKARLAQGASSQPKPVPDRSKPRVGRRAPAVRKSTPPLAPSARPRRTSPREVEAPIEHAATVPEAVTAVPALVAPVVPVASAVKEPMADDTTIGPEPATSSDV